MLITSGLRAARHRFREIFPGRLADETYLDWERAYKWDAHRTWRELLSEDQLTKLIRSRHYREVGRRAIAVYARSHLNLLALYEWMALREALSDPEGARLFAPALLHLVYGRGGAPERIERFADVLDTLPQRQTRLAKWPVVTLFPFVARPASQLVVKPNIMKRAATALGFDLRYASRPNAETYAAVLAMARSVRESLASWHPRDMIDIQGFLWVTNSDEYADWPWE